MNSGEFQIAKVLNCLQLTVSPYLSSTFVHLYRRSLIRILNTFWLHLPYRYRLLGIQLVEINCMKSLMLSYFLRVIFVKWCCWVRVAILSITLVDDYGGVTWCFFGLRNSTSSPLRTSVYRSPLNDTILLSRYRTIFFGSIFGTTGLYSLASVLLSTYE